MYILLCRLFYVRRGLEIMLHVRGLVFLEPLKRNHKMRKSFPLIFNQQRKFLLTFVKTRQQCKCTQTLQCYTIQPMISNIVIISCYATQQQHENENPVTVVTVSITPQLSQVSGLANFSCRSALQ